MGFTVVPGVSAQTAFAMPERARDRHTLIERSRGSDLKTHRSRCGSARYGHACRGGRAHREADDVQSYGNLVREVFRVGADGPAR